MGIMLPGMVTGRLGIGLKTVTMNSDLNVPSLVEDPERFYRSSGIVLS
jgi:hypothetical protein